MRYLEIIENELDDERDKVLNMNDIQITYINILKENGYPIPEKPYFKQYLKKLILDNIPDVHFSMPECKNQPEQVLSTKAVRKAVKGSRIENQPNNFIESKAARILRREILSESVWQFDGTFDSYKPPELFYSFCKQAYTDQTT